MKLLTYFFPNWPQTLLAKQLTLQKQIVFSQLYAIELRHKINALHDQETYLASQLDRD